MKSLRVRDHCCLNKRITDDCNQRSLIVYIIVLVINLTIIVDMSAILHLQIPSTGIKEFSIGTEVIYGALCSDWHRIQTGRHWQKPKRNFSNRQANDSRHYKQGHAE